MEDERERFADLVAAIGITLIESVQNIISGFHADQHRVNFSNQWKEVGYKLYDFTERK